MKKIKIINSFDINVRAFDNQFYIDFGWFPGNSFALFKLQLFENIGGLLVVLGLQVGYLEFSFGVEI